MNILHLHVKSKYFDEIASGEKTEEYRLFKPYWIKRLRYYKFAKIVIYRDYPKKSNYNQSNRIEKLWRSWRLMKIIHPEFGNNPVMVFAIRVNP
jgi:hypothetical protein